MALLSNTDFQQGAVAPEVIDVDGGNITIGELESEGNTDECPDIDKSATGAATLPNHSFGPVSLTASLVLSRS